MEGASKQVFALIGRQRKIFWGISAAILSGLIAAAIPYIYGRLVDIALSPSFYFASALSALSLWLAISILRGALDRFSGKISYETGATISMNLVIDLYRRVAALPLSFHKEKKAGETMRQLDYGAWQANEIVERIIFTLAPSLLSLVTALAVLFWTEWKLAIMLVLFSAVYVLITLSFAKQIVAKQKQLNKGWEKSYGHLWESLINAPTVKMNNAEEFEITKNRKKFDEQYGLYTNWRLLWTNMTFWQGLIFSINFVAVFALGIYLLSQKTITPGTLVMFIGYISLFTAPLSSLADQYRVFRSATTGLKRAFDIYKIAPETDAPNAADINIKGAIKFRGVNFEYNKQQRILQDISFSIKAGETVALIGASGVGKTTLVDLIGKYINPTRGAIFIDNVNLKKIRRKSLRRQIAIVPQDILLFNDTIKNNIRYGAFNATEQQVLAAGKAANAHEFIEKFPKKYKQLVGERGIKLSAGQKQRIAIARALLRDPKILILDEATSALDSESERLVQTALDKLIKGRTTFIIAHRLSTIKNADKIIVLENRKIVEIGTHNQLIRKTNGRYRRYWEIQSATGNATIQQ